jgi:hypothetical protein
MPRVKGQPSVRQAHATITSLAISTGSDIPAGLIFGDWRWDFNGNLRQLICAFASRRLRLLEGAVHEKVRELLACSAYYGGEACGEWMAWVTIIHR